MARILWPGDAGPLPRTPDRRVASIRRTITVDGDRPDGPRGDVVITGRGRDLLTRADGSTHVVAEERLALRADFVTDQAIKEIAAHPGDAALPSLVGVGSRRGFRAAFGDALPHRRDDGSLLVMLLDDVPIVTSLSRMALHRSGAVSLRPSDPNFLGNRGSPAIAARWDDLVVSCAGWAPGTTMTKRIEAGEPPSVSDGVVSPPIRRANDPLAWHDAPDLPANGFRRWRRTDLSWADEAHRLVTIDAWWRDTYVAADGELVVVHEYTVDALVDAQSGVVTACEARSLVLPAPECNRAAPSAGRIVGHRLAAIGPMVRAEFSGPTTCTHLNDELHSLADLHALVPLLPDDGGTTRAR